MPRREISLASYGLATVAEVAVAKGWAAKTIQNWVNAGLLSAVPVGAGRGTFLLDLEEVKNFTPPPRGRPAGSTNTRRKPRRGRTA